MGNVKLIVVIFSILAVVGSILAITTLRGMAPPSAPSAAADGAGPTGRGAPDPPRPANPNNILLPIVVTPTIFYVSKNGDNTDGRSWATAWNELDQIDWRVVQPWNTILLDGGTTAMTYTTSLTIGADGASNASIIIKLATVPGRNGKAIIFGGRSTPLPACDQVDYTYETNQVRSRGIDLGDHSWVIIDGTKWRGITIYGHNETGVYLGSGSSNVVVRNVEIYDNGKAYLSNGLWYPDNKGVTFSGTNNTFERAIIHDNGQDAFQSGGGVAGFTVRQSWLYNGRQHPVEPIGESFNYCTHTDGMQIWGGEAQSGILIEDSIVGPGLTNGVILGEKGDPEGDHAQINNVTIRNTLFINATGNNIIGDIGTKPENWRIENVTSYMTEFSPDGQGHCGLELDGAGHSVTNSIFYHGCFYTPDGVANAGGNCYWQTSDAVPGGQEVDPQFVGPVPTTNNPALDQLVGMDFSVQATSACLGKGARITSVAQLLSQP